MSHARQFNLDRQWRRGQAMGRRVIEAWPSYDITSCMWHKSHDFLGTFQKIWVYKGRFSKSSSDRLSTSASDLLRLFKPLWFCIRSEKKLCLAAFPSPTDWLWVLLGLWCRTATLNSLSFWQKTKSLRKTCFQSIRVACPPKSLSLWTINWPCPSEVLTIRMIDLACPNKSLSY